jgi:hypothetical protein
MLIYAKYNMEMLDGVKFLLMWGAVFCLLPGVTSGLTDTLCLSYLSVVPPQTTLWMQAMLMSSSLGQINTAAHDHTSDERLDVSLPFLDTSWGAFGGGIRGCSVRSLSSSSVSSEPLSHFSELVSGVSSISSLCSCYSFVSLLVDAVSYVFCCAV